MKFVGTKFGELVFEEDEIIVLPKGILGFSQLTRYILVENEGSGPFKWLQSLEDPNVAFVIADPLTFFPNYKLEINEKELEELKYTNSKDLITYVIVTVPQDGFRRSSGSAGDKYEKAISQAGGDVRQPLYHETLSSG